MTVHLVGAGPGRADLLTLRAARLLGRADAVVHDRLVDASVLSLISDRALRFDVGKVPGASISQSTINDLLIRLAREYVDVVRLKGGDPFVFGRGGDEATALRDAGVTYNVVPGLTSALTGPLAAGIPVTHRGVAAGVTIVTGRLADRDHDLGRYAHPEMTLVILMGVARRADIARQLTRAGLSGETPVAVVERAETPHQRVTRGRLNDLGRLDVTSPAVIVIGRAAALDLRDVADVALTMG